MDRREAGALPCAEMYAGAPSPSTVVRRCVFSHSSRGDRPTGRSAGTWHLSSGRRQGESSGLCAGEADLPLLLPCLLQNEVEGDHPTDDNECCWKDKQQLIHPARSPLRGWQRARRARVGRTSDTGDQPHEKEQVYRQNGSLEWSPRWIAISPQSCLHATDAAVGSHRAKVRSPDGGQSRRRDRHRNSKDRRSFAQAIAQSSLTPSRSNGSAYSPRRDLTCVDDLVTVGVSMPAEICARMCEPHSAVPSDSIEKICRPPKWPNAILPLPPGNVAT
jgi:hypothetical protein